MYILNEAILKNVLIGEFFFFFFDIFTTEKVFLTFSEKI